MTLRIGYKPAFLRSYKKLPPALQMEVKERVALFAAHPEHPSLRVHKLKGPLLKKWSFSVNYRYRIVFSYENKSSAILYDVGDHSVYD